MSLLLVCVTTVASAMGASDVAKSTFGNRAPGKEITKGAIFIDGLFMPAPYKLSREGNVILVNGKAAARFTIDEDEEDEEEGDTPTLQEDEDTPTRRQSARDSEEEKQNRAEELRRKNMRGGSLADKAKARERARAPKLKPEFNREASSTEGGNGLFEEADYTYTPPSKPEPKAVPYVRPAARKSLAEIDAERQAKAGGAAESSAEEDEAFKALSKEEIARYKKALDSRIEKLEDALEKEALVLLSSNRIAMKIEGRATMYKFILNFEKDAKGKTAAFVKEWPKLPRSYLAHIHQKRSENLKRMKSLRARVIKEVKAAKDND